MWGKHFKHLEENGKKMSSQLGFLKNKSYEDKGIYMRVMGSMNRRKSDV